MARRERGRYDDRDAERDNERDDRSESSRYPRSERDRDRDRDMDRDQNRGRRASSPPRFRDRPEDRFPTPGPPPRAYDDDYVMRQRDRGRQYYQDDRYHPPPPPPPPQPHPRFAPRRDPEYERRTEALERQRERESEEEFDDRFRRDFSPPSRPQAARRTSSFDGYDRPPINRLYQREQSGPPARRGEYRPPSVTQPGRRTYDDLPYYDEIKVEPDRSGRRVRGRDRSRRSDSRSNVPSSRSSSSSRSPSPGRPEWPKKGKTKIPAHLVAVRAIIDFEYPFVEQGNTIIIHKALSPANIDELLTASHAYRISENEVSAARSSAGSLDEDRHREVYAVPAHGALPSPQPLPPPVEVMSPIPAEKLPTASPKTYAPPTPVSAHAPATWAAPTPPPAVVSGPPPEAIIVNAAPRESAVYRETEEHSTYHDHHDYRHVQGYPPHRERSHSHPAVVYRDISPSRVTTATGTNYTSYSSYSPVVSSPHRARFTTATSGPVVVARDYYYPETSEDVPLGPAAMAAAQPLTRSRSRREIRHEIRALERQLHDRKRGHGSSEVVRTERLPDGSLVVYEEKVETIEQGYKGARIERDKKGPPPVLMRAMLATLT